MERLSDTAIEIINELHTERLDYSSEYIPLIDAANRLAAYEDSGLEPKDIISAVDMAKIACALHELNAYKDLGPIDHIRDLIKAEQDGRLVVLPCKVGDTVYMPVGKWNTITGYEADECDGFHIARDGVLQIKAKCYSGNHGTYGVPGKTVFLTREEAEAALAEKGSTNEDSGGL